MLDLEYQTEPKQESTVMAHMEHTYLPEAFSQNFQIYEHLSNLGVGLYFVDIKRKILFWNRGAEAMTGYLASEIVGSLCFDNLLSHVDSEGTLLCTGECPLSMTMADGKIRHAEVYLRHKSGFRLPVQICTTPVKGHDGRIIGASEIFIDNRKTKILGDELKKLRKLAMIDDLTQLPNRRFIEHELKVSFHAKKRLGLSFGVCLFDIDDFKEVNDKYGHLTGDRVLKGIAQTLSSVIRLYDFIGRWGGEEFLGICKYVDLAVLEQICERYRILVERTITPSMSGEPISVTISMGGTIANDNDTLPDIIERCDSLLYDSKKAGKNRITIG